MSPAENQSRRAGGQPMTPELATQVLEDPETAPSETAPSETTRSETAPSVPAGAAPPAEGVTDGMLQAVVAVVGLGYVGLPTAIALRAAGARIIGIDISTERLEEIRSGEAELLAVEQEQLGGYLQDGGFSLTDRAEALESADLVLVCVPDPGGRGAPAAAGGAGTGLRGGRPPRPRRADVRAHLDQLRRRDPRAAGRAPPGAWAAGRGGGVRGVRPGAHRPRRGRARPAEHAARDRGRQRDLPPAGLVAAAATPARSCTRSPRPRAPRW